MKKYTNKLILILGIPIAIIVPNIFLLAKAFRGTCINAENASQFGDFIGGYVGTILSFISIILILLSFNQQQESSYIEKFENKLFEFIRLHRDNVLEIGIGNNIGKKVFVSLLREFREIVKLINMYIDQHKVELNTINKYNIAYCIFFYGVGPNSSRILKCALKQYDANLVNSLIELFDQARIKKKVKTNRELRYTPFEGHQSRLGHYFRHLYQAVSYVDNQPEKYMNFDQKYKYVKIIRAQLTNHEQAILFLNSISSLGSEWKVNDLITRYSLIKNLPEAFFDNQLEIDVKKTYPKIIFEWEQVS